MSFEVRLVEPPQSRVLPDGGDEELPLASLRTVDDHIHGELQILVEGQPIPHLGFFGPRDVCIGEWVRQLSEARRVLVAAPDACHVYDEGEQGQPAFRFQRAGERVEVSIVASELGAAKGDPEWGTRSCTVAAFDGGVSAFLSALGATLEHAAPGVGQTWVDHQRDAG